MGKLMPEGIRVTKHIPAPLIYARKQHWGQGREGGEWVQEEYKFAYKSFSCKKGERKEERKKERRNIEAYIFILFPNGFH